MPEEVSKNVDQSEVPAVGADQETALAEADEQVRAAETQDPAEASAPMPSAEARPPVAQKVERPDVAEDLGMTPEELEEARADEVAFSWEASEFVHHHKGAGWYAALGGVLVLLVLVAVFLHLWLSIGVFLAMGGAIAVYARKPPKTLLYELSHTGIRVDGKDYPYTEFRSFGVISDLEWHTIDLEPVKRFSPRMALLFQDDDFDDIVGHLELHLPRTDRDPDVIERLTRFLRF